MLVVPYKIHKKKYAKNRFLPVLFKSYTCSNLHILFRIYLMSIDSRLAPQIKAQLARDCALHLLSNGTRFNYTKPTNPKKSTLKVKLYDDKRWNVRKISRKLTERRFESKLLTVSYFYENFWRNKIAESCSDFMQILYENHLKAPGKVSWWFTKYIFHHLELISLFGNQQKLFADPYCCLFFTLLI